MAASSHSREKPHYTGASRKALVVEHKVTGHRSSEQKKQKAAEKNNKNVRSRYLSAMAWVCLLGSGVVGGLITLTIWVGIQWAGFVPPFLAGSHLGKEQVLQIVEIARSQIEKTEKQLSHIIQELDTLKTAFSSFTVQTVTIPQENEISHHENGEFLASLEKKMEALEKEMQILIAMLQDIRPASLVGQGNENDFITLKKQPGDKWKEIHAKNSQQNRENTAIFIAVNALKKAIERGGSYIDELEVLQHVLPSVAGLDLLQKTARTGLPNAVELSTEFASVADTIVGTQNIVAPNAGFFEQLLAQTKNLVVSRPIGEVEGTTLGAIAARMEVAVQAGDYEKALAEWQTLPQSAKDVSVDFIRKLERHLAVRRCLQQLLVSTPQEPLR